MSSIRKYISLANCALQNSIAYRSAYFSNLFASVVFILSKYYLWQSIYRNNDNLAGLSWDEMKGYLLITFITSTFLSLYTEYQVAAKITSGTVAVDLLKPIDFQKSCLAQTLGASLFEGAAGSLLIGSILIISMNIKMPMGSVMLLILALALINSLILRFQVVYIFSLLCFWTNSINGIVILRTAVMNLFSGALVPLVFFPEWLKVIVSYLPFSGIVNTPALIFLNRISVGEAIILISIQYFWIILLWIFAKVFWQFASKQLVIHGG